MPSDAPLVVVVADRGAGKSTLLKHWFRQLEATAGAVPVWLETGPELNDPVELVGRLEEMSSQGPSMVFLDDFHLVTEPKSRHLVLGLPDRASVRLVLATRRFPSLPLARWRASGNVAEVGDKELRLGLDRVAELAVARQLDLDRAVLARIQELTAGWAEGVMTLLDRIAADPSAPAKEIVELAAVHCAESVVRDLEAAVEPAEFEYLVRTSILESFDRMLGSAVARSDDVVDLPGLGRRAPFVEPLDRSGETIRVQPLARLGLWVRIQQQEGSDGIAERHLTAGRYLATARRYGEAVDHLAAAGEPELAADALAALWARRPAEVTVEKLRRVTEAGAAEYVPHLVTRAFGHIQEKEFDEAGELRNRLIGAEWIGPLPHGYPGLDGAVAALTIRLPDLSVQAMAHHADVLVPREIGAGTRPSLPSRYAASHHCYLLGRIDEARERVEAVLLGHLSVGRYNRGDQIVTVLACDLLAILENDHGDHDAARAHVAHGDELLGAYGCGNALEQFEVAVHVRALAKAVAGADDIDRRAETLGRLADAAWSTNLQIHAGIELVRLLDGRRRYDDALAALDRLERKVDGREPAPLLETRLALLRRALRPARTTVGPAMHITTGERAVLYLLADEWLSQAEIGDELGLSINTVKSHLRSIYQKFGVTGRAETITHASEQGLLATVHPWIRLD